jgi:hypothetical protein
VWTKAEEHMVKIEKEYCKENCIDGSVIEPIIIDLLCTLQCMSKYNNEGLRED